LRVESNRLISRLRFPRKASELEAGKYAADGVYEYRYATGGKRGLLAHAGDRRPAWAVAAVTRAITRRVQRLMGMSSVHVGGLLRGRKSRPSCAVSATPKGFLDLVDHALGRVLRLAS
jgi:hypothetical protein